MTFKGTVTLTAGASSYTVSTLNLPEVPLDATGTIMRSGATGSIILASPDSNSFGFPGGTFYFSAPIPNDTTYELFYEFILP